MASQHIEITGTASRYAAALRRMIDNTRELQAEVTKMKDIGDQITYGDPADYQAFASYLGFDDDAAGCADAATVKSLLDAFNTAINNANAVNNLIDQLG